MAKKAARRKSDAKAASDTNPKKKTSLGSLSPATPNEKATKSLQTAISKAIKDTGWSGIELHKNTGISLAMCRRLVRGDKTDMKVSTLARLIECKSINLNIA